MDNLSVMVRVVRRGACTIACCFFLWRTLFHVGVFWWHGEQKQVHGGEFDDELSYECLKKGCEGYVDSGRTTAVL